MRREDYIARNPGSAQRYEESVTIFPGGVTHDSRYATPFPLFMTHGEGTPQVGRRRQRIHRLRVGPRGAAAGPLAPGHRRGRLAADTAQRSHWLFHQGKVRHPPVPVDAALLVPSQGRHLSVVVQAAPRYPAQIGEGVDVAPYETGRIRYPGKLHPSR